MLEKLVKLNSNKKTLSDKEILILIVILFVAITITLLISISAGKNIENKIKKSNTVSIRDVLDIIKDNYSLDIIKNENEKEEVLKIDCDDNICIYKCETCNTKELMKYENKWYTLSNFKDVENSELVLADSNEYDDKFNPIYYNIDLIIDLIEVSNRDSEDGYKINASVSLERYLKEYNYMYEKIEKTSTEAKIPFVINLTSTSINSIIVDYNEVDKFLYNTSFDKLEYTIKLNSLNKNNLEYVRDYFNRANTTK